MRFVPLTALAATSPLVAPAWAQGPRPWQMYDWMGRGWGMWLGPCLITIPLARLIAAIAALARWMGGRDGGVLVGIARGILDERHVRGEIDREEYLRRHDDIAGRS